MSAVPASSPEQPSRESQPENLAEGQLTYKVFKPPNVTSAALAPDLPDEYFSPTAADLKATQHTLSSRTQALVNAPLQLRAVREANDRIRLERWPTTTIRVRFTDRTQLERVFPSTDKIRSIYAFVRGCLKEDVKPTKFILYQTPPKRDLKVSDPNVRDLTLAELHLAPSSVLLLRFEDEALNGSNTSAPLASSVLSQAIDLPAPPQYDVSEPSLPRTSSASSTGSSGGPKKMPKWLKMGLKK